ncbi:pollen-specific leucine-rich repeat extensin-like protein 1 isoform X2 [Sipha flava]|nr:pollen-specific leucine-rich repeat extensin-like protein 1 isoform X2 [Sipha flava]
MPKRGKESRSSSRHSGGQFSPPLPLSSRQPRNDYQIAGPSRIMNISNSPIVLTDDDDDDECYKNVDSSMNIFRENGNKLKPDSGECTRIVKHFVPSADRYQMSQCATDKPRFRGPETDVLHDLEKDKLKNIRVQMIRADVQQNDSFRKAYVIEESAASRSKGEKNHQNFDDRQAHFNPTQQMHYDNGADKNYGIIHMSPNQMMSRDRSLSPRINMGRPPSPPLPYSPERDNFNSDMLRRDRAKRSLERNVHDRQQRPEHFLEQHKIESFSSGPPEPRSPETQRFRSGDHNRHRMKEEQSHYEDRPSRRSRSPVYFGNNYPYRRSMSPNIRPFSPPNHGHLPMSPPQSRELSSPPLRDRLPHPGDRSRRRRSPPPRRDRSRDRRRRLSPRRRTPPPPVRIPIKRRENGFSKKRGSYKNQEARKREAKERKRRSQSKSKSASQQDQQQIAFQQPQPQPMYPPPPPPGVVRLPPPPRPFPPGPMMIPLRPPPFPPPMGGWRPGRPPMQAPPPSGWPYPRPRPFYFPY